MQEAFSEDDFEELWVVVMNTKGIYELSKNQARLVQNAMASGERGAIVFETFVISIPYIAEFYRKERFLKKERILPERTQEPEYRPLSEEKLKKFRKEVYQKIGKPFKAN